MRILTLTLIAFVFFGCAQNSEINQTESTDTPISKDAKIVPIKATIDKEAMKEIKEQLNLNSVYAYYTHNKGDYENWSSKLFGRCCTEVDLTYAETLNFDINTDTDNKDYPSKHLSDKDYTTAYVFKETQPVKINLTLNPTGNYFEAGTPKSANQLLKATDIILSPFKLSLINGYVKSKAIFFKNSRVKTIDVLHNDTYKGTIELLDVPQVQTFSIDLTFKKGDTVTLVPKTFYSGSKYNDVCISEIQTNLGAIAHPSINKQYHVFGE